MSRTTLPSFFIYRNKNKQLIRNIMNNIDWQENDDIKDLSKADSLTAQNLAAMSYVAKMREAADKCGAGFVGGFISPTGERFMMSNMDSDDVQRQAIEEQLNTIQRNRYLEMKKQSADQPDEPQKNEVPDYVRNMIQEQIMKKLLSDFEG